MCTVNVEHNSNNEKKNGEFFLVPWNGQTLLGMPDTETPNIIKINIDSIGAEDTREQELYKDAQSLGD